jgi:anti-sigma B factor antagonist
MGIRGVEKPLHRLAISAKLGDAGGTADMKISTRQNGSATIVDVVGDITLQNSPDFLKVVLDLLRQKRVPKVVMNLTSVGWIDSAGVASLVEGLKVSRELKSNFVLYGLTRTAREVLELTRLVQVFNIYGTEEEALQAGHNGNPSGR